MFWMVFFPPTIYWGLSYSLRVYSSDSDGFINVLDKNVGNLKGKLNVPDCFFGVHNSAFDIQVLDTVNVTLLSLIQCFQ